MTIDGMVGSGLALDQAGVEAAFRAEPSMSLQTYEWFDGGVTRAAQKEAFLAGEITNPRVDYPLLQRPELEGRLSSLQNLLERTETATGLSDEAHAAYTGTLGNRIAEVKLLLAATDLNQSNLDDEQLATAARTYQGVNEQVYGVPEQGIFKGVVAELHAMVGEADYKGQANDIKEELDETFIAEHYDPAAERLPVLTDEAREFLADMIQRYTGPEQAAVARRRVILEAEGRTSFEPEDMVAIINDAIAVRGLSEVTRAFIKSGSSMMAWSQDAYGISVGENRVPIETDNEMFGFVGGHEWGEHALRAIIGRYLTTMAILGNGLATRRPDGTYNSYITWEEGSAAVKQGVASQSQTPWAIENMRGVLHTGLAYAGNDYRNTFETSWRIRSLLAAQRNGGELPEPALATACSQAYDDTLRIYRGTPMDRTPQLGFPVTFNKDLGPYAPGKVLATKFWNENAGNEKLFWFSLVGKFDLTDPQQVAIAHAATNGIFR